MPTSGRTGRDGGRGSGTNRLERLGRISEVLDVNDPAVAQAAPTTRDFHRPPSTRTRPRQRCQSHRTARGCTRARPHVFATRPWTGEPHGPPSGRVRMGLAARTATGSCGFATACRRSSARRAGQRHPEPKPRMRPARRSPPAGGAGIRQVTTFERNTVDETTADKLGLPPRGGMLLRPDGQDYRRPAMS